MHKLLFLILGFHSKDISCKKSKVLKLCKEKKNAKFPQKNKKQVTVPGILVKMKKILILLNTKWVFFFMAHNSYWSYQSIILYKCTCISIWSLVHGIGCVSMMCFWCLIKKIHLAKPRGMWIECHRGVCLFPLSTWLKREVR